MPRGSRPGTTPGTCPSCGRDKVWKADSRRATGGYWTCSHKDAATPGERPPRQHRQRQPRAKAAGTKNWLTDPTRPVCLVEGCMYDAGTCKHARKH
jgi:hypothetical protein